MITSLIPLAIDLIPELAGRLIPGKTGKRIEAVAGAVRDVLGTDDPAKAQEALRGDPEAVTALRVRLAEIAAEAEREERRAEAEALAQIIADKQDARATMVSLKGHALSLGPVLVSLVVVVGFFVTLVSLVFLVKSGVANDTDSAGQLIMQILNIAVGALTAGFATVISFWLGSSNGSQQKDKMMRSGK